MSFSSSTRVLISENTEAAYQKNRDRGFHPQPPVYAVLTDMEKFYFFRYDGSRFSCRKVIFVRSDTRKAFLLGMCEGTPIIHLHRVICQIKIMQ